MPHFRVDDGLDAHPKAQRAGDEALGMWVRAGAWCMRYLTDGFVPDWWVKQQPRGLAKTKQLVAAELWHPSERDGEKGWQFHEFTAPGRQDSRAQIEAERAKWRQKKATQRGMSPGDTPRDRTGEQRPGDAVLTEKRAGNRQSTHQFASRNGHENAGGETHANMAVSNPVTSGDSEMSPGDTPPVSPGDSLHVTRDPTQPIKNNTGYVQRQRSVGNARDRNGSPTDRMGRPTMSVTALAGNPDPPPAPPPPDRGITDDARALVADEIPDGHPRTTVRALQEQTSQLTRDGVDPETVRAALRLWCEKPGVGIGRTIMASLVSEVIKSCSVPSRRTSGTDAKGGQWLTGTAQLDAQTQQALEAPA